MDKKHDVSNLFPNNKYDKWYKKDGEKSEWHPEESIAERVKLRRQKADDEDLSEGESCITTR